MQGFILGGIFGFCISTISFDDEPPFYPGALIAGIIGSPIGMICGFFKGIIDQGKMIINGMNNIMKESKTNEGFNNKVSEREKVEVALIKNLKKFVYFKDNKVVGFIKFARDITPNLNGYYFNCENNIKIEVGITGIILNRNKYLKTPIDLYDSEEYIEQMKNLFKN